MPKAAMSVRANQVNPPKKAKGISKKTKKGWRKNVDITHVEEFLEDQRLEERLGGAFGDRADHDIFTIDTDVKPTEQVDEAVQTRSWRKKREEKPLKCFQHLEITGGVADPKKGRNRRKTLEERKNPTVVAKEITMAKSGIVKAKVKIQKKHRELESLKKKNEEHERTTRRRTKFDFDLWTEKPANTEVQENVSKNDWLDMNTKIHTLKNTGNLTRRAPKDLLEKPSDLNPVDLPHSGMSYNPSLKDHQDLLWKAAVVEMNKERAERKIEYHTTRMFPDAKNAPTHKSWLKEMSEGIPELNKEEEEEDSEKEEPVAEDEDEDQDQEAKMFKPKTKQQRNREKQKILDENRKKSLLEEKKKSTDLFKLRSLKKSLVLDEKTTVQRMSMRDDKKKAKRFMPAQLGSVKFEEPEIEIKLTDELTGNLRSLKPEGNLLEDRFKSFQKRNILETRLKQKMVKTKKRKKVEKRNYKMGFKWEK